MLLGSTVAKAARRMLMKLTPDFHDLVHVIALPGQMLNLFGVYVPEVKDHVVIRSPVPLDAADGPGIKLVVAKSETVRIERRPELESSSLPVCPIEGMKHEKYS